MKAKQVKAHEEKLSKLLQKSERHRDEGRHQAVRLALEVVDCIEFQKTLWVKHFVSTSGMARYFSFASGWHPLLQIKRRASKSGRGHSLHFVFDSKLGKFKSRRCTCMCLAFLLLPVKTWRSYSPEQREKSQQLLSCNSPCGVRYDCLAKK